ncbi:hypothetical protein COCON_G00173670, partial [Conger conger]
MSDLNERGLDDMRFRRYGARAVWRPLIPLSTQALLDVFHTDTQPQINVSLGERRKDPNAQAFLKDPCSFPSHPPDPP